MNRAPSDLQPDFYRQAGPHISRSIHAYTLVNGRPPAQAEIQRIFQVTPPSVHQMLLTLERERLISRRPGMPRSIVVLVDRADLPPLEPGVRSTGQNHCAEVLEDNSRSPRCSHMRRVQKPIADGQPRDGTHTTGEAPGDCQPKGSALIGRSTAADLIGSGLQALATSEANSNR